MHFKRQLTKTLFFIPLLIGSTSGDNNWIAEKHTGFSIHYTLKDKTNEKEYLQFINNGITTVSTFFKHSYKNNFDVFIYPDRKSFDTALQTLFKNPRFVSECWLVATGNGHNINILSPATWDKETPCEGKYTAYSDRIKTQKLITHELVHVFHGQINVNPTLSDSASSMDWFSEGLAFYVSGQLDVQVTKEVRKALSENKQPQDLNDLSIFNDVSLRYSFSGSLVQYIDKTFGRTKLAQLLPVDKNSDILTLLKTTEPGLLLGWKNYVLKS